MCIIIIFTKQVEIIWAPKPLNLASSAVLNYATVGSLNCSFSFACLHSRYVDKLEKIFQNSPADPTQDFNTQVYVVL